MSQQLARRVLVWGEVGGAQATFRENLQVAVERYGPYDLCICLGDFFGPIYSRAADAVTLKAQAAELLGAELPVSQLLILDRPRPDTLGAQLRRAFPEGVEELTPQISLLGSCGRKVVKDLRIAFLTGVDWEQYQNSPEDEVMDLCLMTAWPDNIANGLNENDRIQLDHLLQLHSDEPSLARAAASFANKLLPARYYVAVGGPQAFYERPPFKAGKVDAVSRFIALGPMPSRVCVGASADLPAENRKFAHSLRLIPWTEKDKVVLSKSPFSLESSSAATTTSSDLHPSAKRARTDRPPTTGGGVSRWSRLSQSSTGWSSPPKPNGWGVPPENWWRQQPGSSVVEEATTTTPQPERPPPTVLSVPTTNKQQSSSDSWKQATGSSVGGGKESSSSWAPDSQEEGARVLYVSNVPYAATKEELFRCLGAFGPILDVRLPRFGHGGNGSRIAGRAWVTFERAQDAEAAFNAENINLFGRTLRLVYANIQDQTRVREIAIDKAATKYEHEPLPPPIPDTTRWGTTTNTSPLHDTTAANSSSSNLMIESSNNDPSSNAPTTLMERLQTVPIDVRPHSDCWFCLFNPSCEKKLIVSVADKVYIAIARGGIVPQHLMLLPVSHQPCVALFPSLVLQELSKVMRDLRHYLASQGFALVFFERYSPMKVTRAMHTQVHAVPIPLHLVAGCHEAFESNAVGHKLISRNLTDNKLDHLGDELVRQAERLWPGECMTKDREQLIANQSYYLIDLPVNGEAGELASDRRRTCLYMAEDGKRLNIHFAREALCNVLSAPERVMWKTCVTSRAEEEHWASHVRSGFEAFMNHRTSSSSASASVVAVSPPGGAYDSISTSSANSTSPHGTSDDTQSPDSSTTNLLLSSSSNNAFSATQLVVTTEGID